jgi:toxin-antitoxin system PIN domain toxin
MLADSNVWLALALSRHEHHEAASSWLADLTQAAKVFFCRSTQQSLLRLLTTRAVFAPYGIPPLSNKTAWQAYERFLTDERVSWADEPPGLESHWKRLTASGKASPKLWMDAYLAAFAIAAEYQLVTTDRAFKQFKGLEYLLLS